MSSTKKIKCLAIDDEPLALKQLTSYIEKIPYLELIGGCQSTAEAKEIMEETVIDAIFTDINMPDSSGLEYIQSLSAPPIVVFTTAYAEHAIDGYKVGAVDYLLKPFNLDDFTKAADKVREKYELTRDQQASRPYTKDDCIFVKSEYKLVKINLSTITHIAAMSEYLRIYTTDRKNAIMTLMSMMKLEDRLPDDMFMRIHRSYIINLNMLSEVTKSNVILDNSTSLPIGNLYRERLIRYINARLFDR